VTKKQAIILLYYMAWLVVLSAVVIADPRRIVHIFQYGWVLVLIPTVPSVLLYFLLK